MSLASHPLLVVRGITNSELLPGRYEYLSILRSIHKADSKLIDTIYLVLFKREGIQYYVKRLKNLTQELLCFKVH